ncbi:MAG: hypothetical protein COV48_03115, partial [Elusimicrobia bacterium CG11_big_fil_rev_8_21_14_0_20_64_6]
LEALVAARYPQAPQPDAVRNLPIHPLVVPSAPPQALEAGQDGSARSVPPEAWQQLAPISSERVRVGFDAPHGVGLLLERTRQLLRHKFPEGRLEDIVREVLECYLERKDPQRRLEAKTAKAAIAAEAPAPGEDPGLPTRFPRSWANSRYIPARVKSAVWARDDGRCAWRDKDGTVCGSKDWLEYDHLRPFAKGGRSDDARNIRLVCRQHNKAAALAQGFSVGPACT